MAAAGRGLAWRRQKSVPVLAGGRPGQPWGGRCLPTSASGRSGTGRAVLGGRAWQFSLEGGGTSEVGRGLRPGATWGRVDFDVHTLHNSGEAWGFGSGSLRRTGGLLSFPVGDANLRFLINECYIGQSPNNV